MSDVPESISKNLKNLDDESVQQELKRLIPHVKIPSREERDRMDREALAIAEERQKAQLNAMNMVSALNAQRIQRAKEMFDDLYSLESAIKQDILPCIVNISTPYGVTGTGFFYYGNWLVSNAHVLPTMEAILGCALQTEYNSKELSPIESFHRPHELHTSPDIVVVNDESVGFSRGLKQITRDFQETQKHFFYVYYNKLRGEHEIRHLLKIEQENAEFPLKFKQKDGFEPPKGCSGAPVIEAFVNTNQQPKWIFQVVGVIYARCLGTGDDTKLICTIPIDEEFDKILEVLHDRRMQERHSQMSLAHQALGSPNDLVRSKEYAEKAKEENEKIFSKIKKFESGETSLFISLPEGLEKLYGNNILKLENSLFLENARKRIGLKKDYVNENSFPAHYRKNKDCSLDFLKQEFTEMIVNIRKAEKIKFSPGKPRSIWYSPKEYLRLDIQGGKTSDYSIHLQDCLGYGQKLQGLSGTGKIYNGDPVSSTFAIVRWSKDKSDVDTDLFAEMLEISLNESKEIDLDFMGKRKKEGKKSESIQYIQKKNKNITSLTADVADTANTYQFSQADKFASLSSVLSSSIASQRSYENSGCSYSVTHSQTASSTSALSQATVAVKMTENYTISTLKMNNKCAEEIKNQLQKAGIKLHLVTTHCTADDQNSYILEINSYNREDVDTAQEVLERANLINRSQPAVRTGLR